MARVDDGRDGADRPGRGDRRRRRARGVRDQRQATTTVVNRARGGEGRDTGRPRSRPRPSSRTPRGSSSSRSSRSIRRCPPFPPAPSRSSTVDVMQHVVQVAPELAPTEVWTYVVNGKAWPGTGASEPIVVNEGDKVEITFVNGGSKAMNVTMPHSIDFHSAEVAPNKYYKDIEPGKRLTIKFTADHPGVFMYHCATAAGAHARRQRHGGDDGRQAQGAAGRRQGAVGHAVRVLPRQARRGRRPGQDDGRGARRDRVQRLREPVQERADLRSSAASGSACTCSTPARASGARSTSSGPSSTAPSSRGRSAATRRR